MYMVSESTRSRIVVRKCSQYVKLRHVGYSRMAVWIMLMALSLTCFMANVPDSPLT